MARTFAKKEAPKNSTIVNGVSFHPDWLAAHSKTQFVDKLSADENWLAEHAPGIKGEALTAHLREVYKILTNDPEEAVEAPKGEASVVADPNHLQGEAGQPKVDAHTAKKK